MNSTSFLSSIILALILFCSCQKEISDYVPPASDSTVTDTSTVDTSFLVKRYTEDLYTTTAPDQHVTDSFLLSYDSKGRLLTLTSVKATGSRFVYSYTSKSFVMDLYNNNALSIHETFFLSGQLVDSTIQYDEEGDTTTEKYTYNSGKQVTQVSEYSFTTATGSVPATTTTYTYDVNGDLSSTAIADTITSYTYAKKTINNLDIGLKYFPLPKHLPDGLTYIIPNQIQTGTHTYTFDSLGRLTVDKLELDNDSVAEKRYYY